VSLHPKTTRWFETFVPREQTVYALEALAATGRVELEKDFISQPLVDTRELRISIRQAQRLTARYAELLPATRLGSHVFTLSPEITAKQALCELRRWLSRHLRLQRRLRERERKWRNLELLRECLASMGDAADDLVDFARQGPFLCRQIYAYPRSADGRTAEDPSGVTAVYLGDAHTFQVVLCLPERRAAYDQACRLSQCEAVTLPDWLIRHWPNRHDQLDKRLAALWAQMASLERRLQEHPQDARLANALSDLAVLDWYLEHTVTLTEDRRHCYLTGWTTAEGPRVLQQALDRVGIDAKILFRAAPRGHPAPVGIGADGLVSPFRLFVNLFGTPGPAEFDPAALLTVIVPVLFGFMFPDVGHGLVLAALSMLLSVRFPALRFLVPCGLVAAVFGLLFGEAFGSHAAMPAILFRPLDDPLLVLLISLGFGAGIILLGLVLSGIEAHWGGSLRQWLWRDAAVLVLYASGLVGLFYRPALVTAMLALVWYVAGLLITGRAQLWRGLGRLAQSALELMLNTLSFARIGAFALAHAAMSNALLELASLIEVPALQIMALLLGHALIIVIEALVVFVQTTRLILFEFFTRFLRADGRIFRPLESPGTRP